jgi:hypothetical protein
MADDNIFNGYTPAPMRQNAVDRTLRTTAGAVEGGVKYAAGGWLLWTVGAGVVAAGLLLALPAIVAGIASFAGSLGAFGTLAVGVGVVAAGVAGIFGAVPAILSGLYGAARGGSREYTRSGIDNSLHEIATAEAYGRGVASQQTDPIYVPSQMMNQPSPTITTRDMPDAVTANLAQNTTATGTPIQHQGTIDPRSVNRAAG